MWSYIVLGLIQGLTEFLPISSSGHLVLANTLFGVQGVDPSFNIFVQGGTVISVLLFFNRQLFDLFKKYFKLIILASLPAALIGVLLSDFIDQIFTSLWGVSLGFTLTTIIILLSKRSSQRQQLTAKNSWLIGLSQALAILPGLSRSGTTITTSLLLGISAKESFVFSFLLSIPTIAGASLLSLKSINLAVSLLPSYLIGFFTATFAGYFSLLFLSKLVSQGKFYKFAPYTAGLALLTFYLAFN